MHTYKVVSWNVNGIRALPDKLKTVLDNLDADIICLQETKTARTLVDVETGLVEGYNAYFSFSTSKVGYSGVAIFCRSPLSPCKAQMGIGGTQLENLTEEQIIFSSPDCACDLFTKHDYSLQELKDIDNEGRVVAVQFQLPPETNCTLQKSNQSCCLTVLSVYCPRGDIEKPERLAFKKRFHQLLQWRAEELLHNGSHVIIAGDLNISHKRIDHCDANETPAKNKFSKSDNNSTYSAIIHEDFLYQPARYWIDHLLISQQRDSVLPSSGNHCYADWSLPFHIPNDSPISFVDTFRFLYPNQPEAFTCWCSKTGARQTNYGNRIDYILCDYELRQHCSINPREQFIMQATIDNAVLGSDHCPISTTFQLPQLICSKETFPPICSKYYSQFQTIQKKISDFFTKRDPTATQIFQTDASRKRSSLKQATLFSHLSCSTTTSFGGEKKLKLQEEKTLIRGNSESCSAKSCSNQLADQWKSLLRGPEKAPLCKGHGEPCVLREVKKDSLNKGRWFWTCCKPEGPPGNPLSRCNTFIWKDKEKKAAK